MAVLSSPSLFLGKTTVAWRIGIKWFAMQILFLDESGTAPARNAVERNPYFVLGGLIVPEAQWKSLQKLSITLTEKLNGDTSSLIR